MSLVEHKRTLRASQNRRLAEMTPADREAQSEIVRTRLLPLVGSGTVLAFSPLPSEVDLKPLLTQIAASGRLVMPRVAARALTLHRVATIEALHLSPRGIREPSPASTMLDPQALDVVLVPGLAFTRGGERLGRGGGYYDRLLASLPASVLTVGIAFREQLVDEIPMEPHDIRVSMLVTGAP